MTNRRRVLQVAAASAASLSIGAWAGLGRRPAVFAADPVTDPHLVLFDARFAEARRFGREARALSLPTASTDGDVTSLWYRDLYHRWKNQPKGLAGFTTPETWFVLNGLGADFGLRPVLEVEHRIADGAVSHRFRGPRGLYVQAALDQPGPGWTERMARLLAACPPAPLDSRSAPALSQAATGDDAARATLVSWVLAPIGRSFHSNADLESA